MTQRVRHAVVSPGVSNRLRQDAGGVVVSVNVGSSVPCARRVSDVGTTSIDKRPVDGRVAARVLGLDGDSQSDTRHHGGVDKAVYAYALEDLRWWAAELDRPLQPGQFGENLTTLGIDLTSAVIGERWRAGTALLEVSCPRIPCKTFAGFLRERGWVKRFTTHGAPGAYLRVVEEGELCKGDAVTVVSRPAHGVTLAETFRALTGDRSLAPRLLEAAQLPAEAHERARAWLTLARR